MRQTETTLLLLLSMHRHEVLQVYTSAQQGVGAGENVEQCVFVGAGCVRSLLLL